jgi:hypothetical protein
MPTEGSDRSLRLAIASLTKTIKLFTSSPMMTLIGFFAAFGAVRKFLEGGPVGWATNMARNQPKIHVGIRIRRTWQAWPWLQHRLKFACLTVRYVD